MSWVWEDISAALLVFIALMMLTAFASSLVEPRRKVGWLLLVSICLASNLVFLFGAWEFKKAVIKGQEKTQEEEYQEAYEEGARDAMAELEGYCSQEELEWYGDSCYSEGYEVGYGKGYNDGVDSLPDIWDQAYDEGYLSGYECGAFDAQ